MQQPTKGKGGAKKPLKEILRRALRAFAKRMKKDKGFRIGVIAVSSLLVLILLGVIAYNAILDHYLDKINVVTEENLVYQTEIITGEDGPSAVEDPEHNGELNDANLPLICNTKDVTNVLLLAVDSRGGDAGRSDTMILVSINQKTGKVVLCSFLRDILAAFPKEPASPVAGMYDKLTHAHAYGGPELTMAVLKETFNIEVAHYAKVNFSAFVSVVDAMGGVDLYLTSGEAAEINAYETLTAKDSQLYGYKANPLPVKEGVAHLNGVQALTHARNRTIGSDWARTQRQRDVIQALAKKAKNLSLSQLNNLLNTVLPLITTNMPKDMMKDLIGKAPALLGYEIESTRVPGNGLYTERNYQIICDLEANCTALYELIYGEKAPQATGQGKNPLQIPSTSRNPVTTTTAPPTTTTVPPTTTTAPPVTTTKSPEKEPETKEPETKEPETKEPETKEPETKEPTTEDVPQSPTSSTTTTTTTSAARSGR